jgi:hypothetical protein
VGLVAANLQGLKEARDWRRERLLDQYVTQTYKTQTDAALARLGPPSVMRTRVAALDRGGLSAFAEPQRLLLLIDASTGVPTREILRGQQVQEILICPVEELHDVGVLILPAAKPGPGTFEIVVRMSGRELARRSWAIADFVEWTWVRVPLESSVPCQGRQLEITVESSLETAGASVRGLAAEPFYGGDLTQGGTLVPTRQLGIALNAYHFSILAE